MMNTFKKASCWLLMVWISILSTSCKPSFSSENKATSYSVTPRYASVCEIRHDMSQYVGKIVRLHVTYKSDHMFYSYLFDRTCREQKTINVAHPIRTRGDTSVTKFFYEEDERCRKSGTTVCPVEADLDVEALISISPDGSLIAEFKHVISYKFL